MGRDIQPIKITGEDRGNYRDKLQRSLEVFARMLREHLFDADTSHVGLEIELNLVDDRGAPSMHNADVLDAIADPAWATELGQFNLEINIPPRRLDGDCMAGLEDQRVESPPVGDQFGEPAPGHAAHPGAGGARGKPGGAQPQGQVPEGLDVQRGPERLGTGGRRGHTEIMTYPSPRKVK